MKKNLINAVVKKLNNISEQSVGINCAIFLHQPKEPAALQKLKK